MIVTQDMYDVCLQKQRNLHIKINLLNFQFLTVNELSGVVIESPQITQDANSDIRRTCNISMCVKDSDFDIQAGGQIWLDKFLQIYIGVDSIRTRETIWFNMGIYLINSPSFNYDSETNTLSFEGLDLMSKLTGIRNGYLEGIPYIIPQDSNIKETVIDLLKQSGFTKYIIDIPEEHSKTPYEIKVDIGGTVYDI